jgi:hypothetical protein
MKSVSNSTVASPRKSEPTTVQTMMHKRSYSTQRIAFGSMTPLDLDSSQSSITPVNKKFNLSYRSLYQREFSSALIPPVEERST